MRKIGKLPRILFAGLVVLLLANAGNNYYHRWLNHRLMQACEYQRGSDEEVRSLLRRGANPNTVDPSYGYTPLLWAVIRHRQQAAMLLIQAGADVNVATIKGESVLDLLASHTGWDPDLIRLLFARGARSQSGIVSPLCLAASYTDRATLEPLLKSGADPHQAAAGTTPMECAVLHGKPDNLGLLLQHGGYDPRRDARCLRFAIERGDLVCADLLLKAGANVNGDEEIALKAEQSTLPILPPLADLARQTGPFAKSRPLYAWLLAHGAEIDRPITYLRSQRTTRYYHTNHATPLILAAQQGDSELVAFLLQHRARTDARTEPGIDAAGYAARSGREDIVAMIRKTEGR